MNTVLHITKNNWLKYLELFPVLANSSYNQIESYFWSGVVSRLTFEISQAIYDVKPSFSGKNAESITVYTTANEIKNLKANKK